MGKSDRICRMAAVLLAVLTLCAAAVPAFAESYTIALYDGDIKSNRNMRYMTARVHGSTASPMFGLDLWQGECRFDIDLNGNSSTLPGNASEWQHSLSGDTVVIANDDMAHRFYRNKSGLEWEIVLLRRPDTGVFGFDVSVENLSFHYQDSLSAFELDTLRAFRPDSVVGAWVAYHSLRSNDVCFVTGEDSSHSHYGTGQAFIIYRPRAWDGDDTTWCDVTIDTDKG